MKETGKQTKKEKNKKNTAKRKKQEENWKTEKPSPNTSFGDGFSSKRKRPEERPEK